MKKRVLLIVAMTLMAALLASCEKGSYLSTIKQLDPSPKSGESAAKIDKPASDLKLDKYGSWAYVSGKKMQATADIKRAEADKALAEMEKARFESEDKPKTEIIIDSAAELKEYKELELMRALVAISKQNGEVAKLALQALQPQQRDTSLDIPEQPKGWAAETIKAGGEAIGKVFATDTALAGMAGYMVGKASGDRYVATEGGSNSGNDVNQSSKRDLVSYSNPSTHPTIDQDREVTVSTTTKIGNTELEGTTESE